MTRRGYPSQTVADLQAYYMHLRKRQRRHRQAA